MSILRHIGRTPLVELTRIGRGLPVPVLVKCEHMNPGGSIKDRVALAIVADAEARGALRPGMTLVEATAGNTGVGLALVAAARGYGLVCVMPEKMSVDKRASLAALGAEVMITPNAPPSSPDNFRRVAERLAHERGWFLTDQFNNPVNVQVHEETTGVEILEQTGGRVGAFVAGAGTGGTISGVGRCLDRAIPGVRVVLADPIGSGLADWVDTGTIGPDGSYAVEGIGGSEAPSNLHRDVIDAAERVSDGESFAMTKRLVREEGLLVGGSAGTNVVAALRVAARGGLDGPVVTVLPDSWDRYRAKPWMQDWTALLLGPALVLSLLACSRAPSRNDVAPRGASTATPADAAPAAAAPADAAPADAAVFRGPHATDAPMARAFWTRGGALVASSKTDLWKLDPACGPPQRVPLAIDGMITENGVDAFVVARDGAFTLWDAAAMHAVGPIDHPARDRGGAIARQGGRIALGGCKEIAADPKLVTSCGELYDAATGRRTAGFVGKHDFDELAFSDDGKYLVARGSDHGLSVFDTATGKVLVTRPRWAQIQEVHGWNRPDVAEVVGDELVVVHGETVEHVDLPSGKTLGKLVTPGRTLAVFGRKSRRVAVFQGDAARARVWDVASHTVVRTFELAKQVAAGANCRHCALEIDEVDEDRVWLTSAYTDDRLLMRIGTGEVKRVDAHAARSESRPSSTHRVEEGYDYKTREVLCTLDRRDRDAPPVTLPVEYCNRTYGPSHRRQSDWPYPGFDPSGRFLGSIYRSQLRLWDVERGETVCVAGASSGEGGKRKAR